MRIMELKPQKKHLTLVTMDEGEPVLLDKAVAEESGLRVGQMIEDTRLQKLAEESAMRRAKERALWYLSSRDYSCKELVDKLCRTTDRETAQAVVTRLQEVGLVNNEAYARRLIAGYREIRGYGDLRIRQELYRKGMDRDMIDELFEELESDPILQICELLEGKFQRNLSNEKGIQRTVAALARRGYTYADIKSALREYLDREQEFTE